MTIREYMRILKLRKGAVGCFDQLFAEYGARVFRFCLRLTGNHSDAEDLAQDTFIGAMRGMERFEGRSSISTWLYRIAILRFRTAISRSNTRGSVSLDADGIGENLIAADSLSGSVARFDIETALQSLSGAHRTAFILVKAEGLTCREAAEVLQIPEGTVRYHVHEAIVALRAHLAPEPDSCVPARWKGEASIVAATTEGRL